MNLDEWKRRYKELNPYYQKLVDDIVAAPNWMSAEVIALTLRYIQPEYLEQAGLTLEVNDPTKQPPTLLEMGQEIVDMMSPEDRITLYNYLTLKSPVVIMRPHRWKSPPCRKKRCLQCAILRYIKHGAEPAE